MAQSKEIEAIVKELIEERCTYYKSRQECIKRNNKRMTADYKSMIFALDKVIKMYEVIDQVIISNR